MGRERKGKHSQTENVTCYIKITTHKESNKVRFTKVEPKRGQQTVRAKPLLNENGCVIRAVEKWLPYRCQNSIGTLKINIILLAKDSYTLMHDSAFYIKAIPKAFSVTDLKILDYSVIKSVVTCVCNKRHFSYEYPI